MTPEERKEYNRLHYLKNKEKRNEKNRNNYLKNKEKYKERCKKYSQTENGKKANTINSWKRSSVICEDFDKLHDTYINTNNCEWCNKDVSKRRDLEHNHYSCEIRGIVCRKCNMKMKYKDERYQKCMLDLVGLFIK